MTANIGASLFSFAVATTIGLWYTPFLVRSLGVDAYGLIPLATSVTAYLGLATITLNGAVGRFLTIAIERDDVAEANRVFNTALVGNLVVGGLLVVPAFLAATKAGAFFNLPGGCEQSFVWLFFLTISSFFLAALTSSFSAAAYCRNRLDLSSLVESGSTVLRVGIAVVLLTCLTPQVWQIGVGIVAAALFSLGGAILLWRRLTPCLRIAPRAFDLGSLRNLTAMGGWMFLSQVGALLFLSMDLIVVNKMLGPEAGGRYGAIMQWPLFLRSLAGVIAAVFGPPILMLYARDDQEGLVQYTRQAMKFVALVMALPIGIICGFSAPLLSVWLGPDFVPLAPLLSLMTIHLAVNLGVLPLFNIRVAMKKVRVPGLLTCGMGVLNFALAILLAGAVGWGMYGVAAASAVTLTAANLVFGPWYAAHILGVHPATFFRGTVPNILVTLGVTATCWITAQSLQLNSWRGLLLGGGIIATIYALVVFCVLLTRKEREALNQMLWPRCRFLRGWVKTAI